MLKTSLRRACPVCAGRSGAELLHTQRFVLPAGHPLPDKYDVVACGSCGFVYADTPADQDAYDKYYGEMSKYEMAYTSPDTSLFIDRAAWISGFVRGRGDSVIDIGCGNGELIAELRKLGLTDLTGLDPSEKCVSALKSRGIRGIRGSVFSVSAGRKYDCAVLSGVLEHIYDVGKIMKTMSRLLTRRGLLFVCVPDASRYPEYDAVPFDYFNIEHINHFDETSLLNLGLRHGFNMVGSLKTTVTLSKTTQPMVFCVYENAQNPAADSRSYSRNRVAAYIGQTNAKAAGGRVIGRLARGKREVIVWGAGNYTSRLLACSGLARCNIVMVVDNDRHKQGMSIGGHTVRPPAAIRRLKKNPAILVSVAVFSAEVIAEIRAMGLSNEVLVLK